MSEIEGAVPASFELRESAAPLSRSHSAVTARRVGLAVVCLAALIISGAHIRDEGYVSLQGDMPRYLMNGVFLTDLLKDRPFASVDTLIEYTYLYYARYPALSLGHHPPLLSAAAVPIFGVFGPSIWAARLVMVFSFASAAAFLFLLVSGRYGVFAAGIAAMLFVTSPLNVELGQAVLSEIPAIALLLAAVYSLERFLANESRWALVAFVVAATASLYTRPLAIVVFPVFLIISLAGVGWRRLLRRDVLIAVGVLLLLLVPLGLMTVSLAPTNIGLVAATWVAPRDGFLTVLRYALRVQLSKPVVILAALGILLAVVRRDRRAVMFLAWIGCVFLGLYFPGLLGLPRYSVFWVPALCAIAGSLAVGWRHPWLRWTAAAVLVAATGHQATAASVVTLPKAGGYEEAAQFVLASNPGPTVLFSGVVDTGFFTFFVRKHDPARQLVVLRADKLLTTSYLASSEAKSRIGQTADVYPLLHRFGTRFIVLEDRAVRAPTLEAFRKELLTSRFIERKRIAIDSTDHRLRGTSLVVYEFLDAGPADPNALLSMDMPVVSRSLGVRLSDLIDRKYLR
jgi:hypothetical protein